MKRVYFFLFILFTFSYFTFAQTEEKPNVLFIAIDDLNEWVGFMNGHPQVQTPNLDNLAARSLVFNNAYCSAPVCNPSRASLLTGLNPTTTGIYQNNDLWTSDAALNATTLPHHFRNNGYYTVWAGKIFHKKPPAEQLDAMWDDYSMQSQRYKQPDAEEPVINLVKYELAALHFQPWEGPDEDFRDIITVNYFKDFVARDHEKPWFFALGLIRPHTPWTAPKRFFDIYPPANEIILPEVPDDDMNDIPPVGLDLALNAKHDELIADGVWPELVRAYLACVSFADFCVGETINALKNSAYSDNTIIVLWSDHGWHHGQKKHWRKSTLWEIGTHNLLMMQVPGSSSNSKRTDKIVSLLDIYPTLSELCSLPENPELEGKSLVPLFEDVNNPEWKAEALTTMGIYRNTVRGENHRYIRYNDSTEELYDHRVDSLEWNNIAEDESSKSIIEELNSLIPEDQVKPSTLIPEYYIQPCKLP